jgi:polyhydroxyalkanoate synthesis regulator phasin
MASDFGDESGEKLIDWMMRVGEDAGKEAMLASADKLAEAFRRAREGLDKGIGGSAREWAKLDMKDFKDLPAYDSIKQIIDGELAGRGVEHEFASEGGRDFLVFKVKDVHEVSDAFPQLDENTAAAKERAEKSIDEVRDGDRDARKRPSRDGEGRGSRPKGPDLDAPATEKQREYIGKLVEKGAIPEDEAGRATAEDLTVGQANGILNKYGRYLKLERDAEPLEQRAEAARRASKALENAHGGRERNLEPVLGK